MSARDWTDDRVERLKAWFAQGYSAAVIARMFIPDGVVFTRNSVIGKLTRLGLMGSMDTACKRARAQANAKQSNRIKRAKGSLPSSKPNPRKPTELYFGKGAERGEWNVRFEDRARTQCPRFVEGEEGARGYVCGRPTQGESSWCAACSREVFQVQRVEKAA